MATHDFTPTAASRAALRAFDQWSKAHPDRSVIGRGCNEAMRDMILYGIVLWLGNGRVKLIDDRERVTAYNRWRALLEMKGTMQ